MIGWLARLSSGELACVVAIYFAGLTAIGLAIGFALERGMPKLHIWSDPIPEGQYQHEAIGNLVFLSAAIASFTLALRSDLVVYGDDSAVRIGATFVALYLGFQAHFYLLHRLLHTPALVRFHRWHHVSRVTTPLSGQSTSLVEALGWMIGYVLMPVAFSYVAPISAVGWAGYVAFNVIGNIVGHANVEVVPKAPGLWHRSLFATVFTYHALHHLRWAGHYGFGSTWMDRLLGTEWSDWMSLYEQVVDGRPLELAKTRRVDSEA